MEYSVKNIPKIRRTTMDFGRLSQKRHSIVGLLEIDISDSRMKLRELKKESKISFNGWLIKQISDHLSENKHIAAFSRNKKKLYLFDAVNMSILIEKDVGGEKVPLAFLIEKADKKSAEEITAEIEKARKRELEKNETVIERKNSLLTRIYYNLPPFARRTALKLALRNPTAAFRQMGNAVITSVGTIGQINGWFIQSTLHPVSFGLGSINTKPWVVNGEIKTRQILHMTISFDHDIIDGGAMARFVNSLVKKIESADSVG